MEICRSRSACLHIVQFFQQKGVSMSLSDIFKMPKPVSISGRTSSITNAFVNGIIPCIVPSEKELQDALNILGLNDKDLRCAYCGDKATEWDHLRPLVKDKKPTGYISEIHNLVPACGKCNQSKGNKYWREWIQSTADLSPKSRGITELNEKIIRLEQYEQWKDVKPIDFEAIAGADIWKQHWENHEHLLKDMKEYQKLSVKIKERIQNHYRNNNT